MLVSDFKFSTAAFAQWVVGRPDGAGVQVKKFDDRLDFSPTPLRLCLPCPGVDFPPQQHNHRRLFIESTCVNIYISQ